MLLVCNLNEMAWQKLIELIGLINPQFWRQMQTDAARLLPDDASIVPATRLFYSLRNLASSISCLHFPFLFGLLYITSYRSPRHLYYCDCGKVVSDLCLLPLP